MMPNSTVCADARIRAKGIPLILFFKEDLDDKKYLKRASDIAGVNLKDYIAVKDFKAGKDSSFEILFPKAGRKRVMVFGLGETAKAGHESLWKSGLKLFGRLKAKPAPELALVINLKRLDSDLAKTLVAAMFDAAWFASFNFEKFIRKPKRKGISGVQLLLDKEIKAAPYKALVKEREIYGEAVNVARSVIVEPGSHLPPATYADRMVEHLKGTGVKVKVHNLKGIEKLKLHGVLAVGRGSKNEPRYVEMSWNGAPDSDKWLGLVGKGVTFDTGGISLKRPQGMWKMKYDMSGSAAVLGAMLALGKMKAPVNVRAVTPLVENMPGGNSFLPGDVITYDNGLSVEIMSTDAEGRLILADGIMHLSREPEISRVVSIATLTGAMAIALGRDIAGGFSKHEGAVEDLKAAALRAGELIWPLPMHEPYGELLKSDCADMKNGGDGTAGSIVAAMMLDRFSEQAEFVHLDIAGVAWMFSSGQPGPGDSTPRGVGVKLLAELAKRFGGDIA